MITELWWRAFLAAIVTTIIANVFNLQWDIFLVFLISYIGWFAIFVLSIIISETLKNKIKNRH